MVKKCTECGKKKGFFTRNYAGFDVGLTASHPIANRIEPLVLPGVKQKDFLCVDCANERKVVCSKHGEVQGRIEYGATPTCQKCAKEEQQCPQCGRNFAIGANRATMNGIFNKGQQAFVAHIGNTQVHLKCPYCGVTFLRIQ